MKKEKKIEVYKENQGIPALLSMSGKLRKPSFVLTVPIFIIH